MKARIVILVLAAAAILGSCASFRYPARGDGLVANLEPQKYEMLGEVKAEGTTRSILGLYTWGGGTYGELIEKAKKLYGADDVINVSEDRLNSFLYIIYFTQTYSLRGIAIKYIK